VWRRQSGRLRGPVSVYRGLGRRQAVLCLAGHQITSKPRVSPPDLTTTQYHVIINFTDIQWMTNETQISKTAIKKTEDSPSSLILVSYAASDLPQRIRKTAAPVFMYCLHNVSHRYNGLLLKWHRTSCLTEKFSTVYILRFVCRGSKCCEKRKLNCVVHYFCNYVNIEVGPWICNDLFV